MGKEVTWKRFVSWIFLGSWIGYLPESTDVGIECCRSKTNRNILSPAGRNPSLSASITMPRPVGGTNTKRPKIIAAVVLSPSFELPGPKHRIEINIQGRWHREKFPDFHLPKGISEVAANIQMTQCTIDKVSSQCQQYARDHGLPETQTRMEKV